MGAVPLDPTCDICGTTKQNQPGVGLYCPNNRCGEDIPPPPQTLPEGAHALNIHRDSVMLVLRDQSRQASASLAKVEAVGLFGILGDGSNVRIEGVLLQVKAPKVNRKKGPSRTTSPSLRHPEGVRLSLASRDGVNL